MNSSGSPKSPALVLEPWVGPLTLPKSGGVFQHFPSLQIASTPTPLSVLVNVSASCLHVEQPEEPSPRQWRPQDLLGVHHSSAPCLPTHPEEPTMLL